ncbi:hypothetical protein ACLKA6_010339 [Drosophila palustris]
MNLLNESLLIEYIFIEYSPLSYYLKRKRQNKVVEELATFNTLAELCRYGVPNIKNSVPKCTHFTNQVLPNLDEHRFKQLIRFLPAHEAVFFGLDQMAREHRSQKLQLFLESVMVALLNELHAIAILMLTKSYIRWPNCAERRVLADEGGHELPECIGYVDGTEIKLAEKPLQDPESYFSRKQQYSLKLQAQVTVLTNSHRKSLHHFEEAQTT